MSRSAVLVLVLVLVASTSIPSSPAAAVSPEALSLRDRGVAELENEKPGEAGETFRKLVKIEPEDPLGWANLAIAALRQQKGTEAAAFVQRALEKAPERADLLQIKGDVLQWTGRPDLALDVYREAAEKDPDHPEILYSLYRQATTLTGEQADRNAAWALERLVRIRPENPVVLLQRGQRAIAEGRRADATESILRIQELLWQAPPIAERALDMVLDALEGNDLSAARVPAVRLENVLKITPMFQQGLRELSTGIQGIPVWRFRGETPPRAFGNPIDVTWHRRSLADGEGLAVVAEDLDGDQTTDLAWVRDGEPRQVQIRLSGSDWKASATLQAPGVDRLLAVDLDNDGHWDLVGTGSEGVRAWKGDGKGGFSDETEAWGLGEATGAGLAAFDFDIEGDLDLVVGGRGEPALQLYRNTLEGALETVTAPVFPKLERVSGAGTVLDLVASDVDRDGDLDLLVAHGGVSWLDNLRQGQFVPAPGVSTLGALTGVRRLTTGDFDGDGHPDLVTAGTSLEVRLWRDGGFPAASFRHDLPGEARAVVPFDLDNDGRLDLAVATGDGLVLFGKDAVGKLAPRLIEGVAAGVADVAAADLDGDGDLDLVTAGADGLVRLENRGGDGNHWLALRLQGLTKGNSKNNVFGLGAVIEIRNGPAYQFREARGGTVHFGLGDQRAAEVLRVVWTNGVPQNRISVRGDQRIVEEQLLKGSCPFLYAWNGEEVAFVTDLLWGAPLGLPVAPGKWAGADPSEIVLVTGAVPDAEGLYDLRITEELWEAAYFDRVRLWVVDHPADVEVASNLRIVPGEIQPEEVRASRDLRPVAAWDGSGAPATERVAARDDVYASGFEESRYQGVAAAPWAFTFDLGTAPRGPIRLHLDGWIFPADASLNLALAQRTDSSPLGTRLEVEVDGEWRPLLDPTGFPAGKTKTMVLDLPPLPPDSTRLRIVSNQWLAWDRIAWTDKPADGEARTVARLEPGTADLRYRGFSRLIRRAPNAPHEYDYARLTTESPWLPFAGSYTRYGDVAELLAEADDRSVILGAGDEMRLLFDASHLPAPPPGHERSVFLESLGWDKDADRNTYRAQTVEPLPFRAMNGYPWSEDESFPSTPQLDAYRAEWLTRVVEPEEGQKGEKAKGRKGQTAETRDE